MIMTKRIQLSTLALCAGLLAAGTASAQLSMPNSFYPNGYYMGGGIGFSSIDLNALNVKQGGQTLKNTSPGKEKQPGAFVKFGYAFKSIPVQLGLSYQQNLLFKYKTNPLFNGRNDQLSSKITTHVLFANATLNANFGFPVIPFITGGFGMSMNSVDMNYTNGSRSDKASKNTFHDAWQIGLGTHIRLTDNLLFDVTAYHQNLGKLRWGPWGSNPTQEIDSDGLTANQAQLGLTYVFGDQHIPPSLIRGD